MHKTEIKILKNMIKHVGEHHGELPHEQLTGFVAMKGSKFNGAIMVIGRAVNGWDNEWYPRDAASSSGTERIIGKIAKSVDIPLSWVSKRWGHNNGDYNTKKSAFWRTVRGVVSGLGLSGKESTDWPDCIVWSNLYKVAPKDGGNPSSRLCSLQEQYCKELLSAEIELYKPKRIIFSTGYDWAAPFIKDGSRFYAHTTTNRRTLVQAIASYKMRGGGRGKVVVAAHPQGKGDAKWINDVVRAFSA